MTCLFSISPVCFPISLWRHADLPVESVAEMAARAKAEYGTNVRDAMVGGDKLYFCIFHLGRQNILFDVNAGFVFKFARQIAITVAD